MGTGLIVVLFFLALIYLWVHEKRKELRVLFLYMPIVLLLLYFNPVFARFVFRMSEGEIYYRILWLIPITVVLAYTCVCIYGQIERGRESADQKICDRGGRTNRNFFCRKEKHWLLSAVAVVCMAGGIMVSGSYIYSNPYFHEAENLYHVPNSVVHICDAIHVPGREVMAVFPLELVQYVRQYSPVTRMPYGREMTVERWKHDSSLCEAMEAEVVDMEELVPLVREAGCHYVILPVDKEMKGKPEDYGWIWFAEMDGYVIYRDPAMELVIPVL